MLSRKRRVRLQLEELEHRLVPSGMAESFLFASNNQILALDPATGAHSVVTQVNSKGPLGDPDAIGSLAVGANGQIVYAVERAETHTGSEYFAINEFNPITGQTITLSPMQNQNVSSSPLI